MRFILILITTFLINSGCDTYSEHSIYLREMEENDSLIILKQVHYGKGFITTNINDEVYLNNETFVKIDTVSLDRLSKSSEFCPDCRYGSTAKRSAIRIMLEISSISATSTSNSPSFDPRAFASFQIPTDIPTLVAVRATPIKRLGMKGISNK